MAFDSSLKTVYLAGFSQKAVGLFPDTSDGRVFYDYSLYIPLAVLSEEDQGSPEDNPTISGNSVSQNDLEDQEGEEDPEDSVSANTPSENRAVSGNSASDNAVSENYIEYEGSTGSPVYINIDSTADDYLPQITEILGIIGGILVFFMAVVLLKYIYKFFRIFF